MRAVYAQRRPGPRPRRHLSGTPALLAEGVPLNEGRGRDPGDTATAKSIRLRLFFAQRRPGPRPRRHSDRQVNSFAALLRSTKAGAETPATLPHRCTIRCRDSSLNEGRGRDPGDTCPQLWQPHGPTPLNEGRGRDPGDTRSKRTGDTADLSRSTKAGAETPATRESNPRCTRGGSALNEGRGRDPGDTRTAKRPLGSVGRSTKAGAETPATHDVGQLTERVLPLRSTKAGAETPATLFLQGSLERPGIAHRRSTKAGAETPATRPRHEGDDHYRPRSTKAGAETPATRPSALPEARQVRRSTKAGAETPATLLIGAEHLHGCNSVPGLPTPDRNLTTGSACVWVRMSSQTRRCPRNLRRITTLSQAALESPGVRRSSVRAPKARRARASQSGQTGSELPKCHS